jgi:hypothetical protein
VGEDRKYFLHSRGNFSVTAPPLPTPSYFLNKPVGSLSDRSENMRSGGGLVKILRMLTIFFSYFYSYFIDDFAIHISIS